MTMLSLREQSLTQLLVTASELRLLNSHRAVDHFYYLDVGGQRFLFDHQMARTFLLGLLSGQLRKNTLRRDVSDD